MSPEKKIATLEGLLTRIDARRRPLESVGSAAVAAAPVAAAPVAAASAQRFSKSDPVPDGPPGAVVSASQRPRSKTPMEQALSLGLDAPEPSVEIEYEDEDDGPIITIEPGPPDDVEDELDQMPTAPVGTPAVPRERAPAAPARSAAATPAAARPMAPRAEAAPSSTAGPVVVETAVPLASSPIANVVSQPAPRTFGELLDRALALRPR